MDEGRGFTIIDYEDRYKQALEDISLPWLLEYDLLEPVDLEMLAEPHRFLSGGGRVLLARWGEEIVGMVMLELQGKGQCELLKFGVKEAYRGRELLGDGASAAGVVVADNALYGTGNGADINAVVAPETGILNGNESIDQVLGKFLICG